MKLSKTKTLVSCFLFAMAFVLVLGVSQQSQAGLSPCCQIVCPPGESGPGGNIGTAIYHNGVLIACDPFPYPELNSCYTNAFACSLQY